MESDINESAINDVMTAVAQIAKARKGEKEAYMKVRAYEKRFQQLQKDIKDLSEHYAYSSEALKIKQ